MTARRATGGLHGRSYFRFLFAHPHCDRRPSLSRRRGRFAIALVWETLMNARERFHQTMTYGARNRAPFQEFFWPTWPETVERWQHEGGYEPGKTNFGCDHWVFTSEWFFPNPPFERRVVAEDDIYVTYEDPQGMILREHKLNPLSSMPQFLRFPVETREDFRKFWKNGCARI